MAIQIAVDEKRLLDMVTGFVVYRIRIEREFLSLVDNVQGMGSGLE